MGLLLYLPAAQMLYAWQHAPGGSNGPCTGVDTGDWDVGVAVCVRLAISCALHSTTRLQLRVVAVVGRVGHARQAAQDVV
jgi:hypothetical protein